MNRKTLFLTLGIVLVLLASAFLAGKASASVGCFSDTNGNWAETFICWLKENGISIGYGDGTFGPNNNVTRAEMATFLYRAHNVPPSTGNILVNTGFSNWQKLFSSDPLTASNFDIATYFKSSSASSYTIGLQPDLPVVFYGKSLQLLGAEICYRAISGSNYLNEVRLRTYTQSSSLGTSSLKFTDATDRHDTACRYYLISTPVLLTPEMGAEIYMDVTWTVINTEFGVGRATFVFAPTETTAPGVSEFSSDNAVVLQAGGSGPEDQH